MKHLVSILLCFLGILQCHAQSISRETARIVANNYWKERYAEEQTPISRLNANSCVYTISPLKKADLYVVQMEDGWVLVSSEIASKPILASSPTGFFPLYEDMPDGMQWLLSYYEESIQYARDSIESTRMVNEEWEQLLNGSYTIANQYRDQNFPSSYVLDRMSLVKWNQSTNNDNSCTKPYNAKCPTWSTPSCGHTYVGCTAIAMAQVLWYWQWPYSAIIPRILTSTTTICSYSNFPYLATYDWAHLPAELHNSTSTYDAIHLADFLRDCGYAIKMVYRNDGSSASIDDARTALNTIFHYKPILKVQRRAYSSTAWINLLKQEIYAGRPIVYCGDRDSSHGHAFVVFGYTNSDMFRVNWGWGGAYMNAEYSIDALGPGEDYYYNDNQEALLGVEPDSPECLSYNFLQQNSLSNSIFEIHKAGILVTDSTHGEIRIHPNQQGCIYASDAIVIYHPFVIEEGARVHIALRDALCDNRSNQLQHTNRSASHTAKVTNKNLIQHIEDNSHTALSVFPNPTVDHIQVVSNAEINTIFIINSDGLCVRQSKESYIHVGDLPTGLYIVLAHTNNGELLQTKFLKI